MELPFSPLFFRKVAITQQLLEYDSLKEEKHLWEAEKAVLFWSASDGHQHVGQDVDWNNIDIALTYAVEKKFLSPDEKKRVSDEGNREQILKSLIVHEFATRTDNNTNHARALINRNGILAGKILKDTKNLSYKHEYDMWSFGWYALFYLGVALLILQVVSNTLDTFGIKSIQETFPFVGDVFTNFLIILNVIFLFFEAVSSPLTFILHLRFLH